MTIRNLFMSSVSALLIVITLIACVIVAVGTQDSITSQVLEKKNDLREEVNSILSVTDELMAKRVQNSLNLLVERGERFGTPEIAGTETVAGTSVPALYLGDELVNNNFDLVDGLSLIHI